MVLARYDGLTTGTYILYTAYQVPPWSYACYALLNSAECQVASGQALYDFHDQNSSCAVCEVTSRSKQIMIPGRYTCPDTWTVEYSGWLMTEYTASSHVYVLGQDSWNSSRKCSQQQRRSVAPRWGRLRHWPATLSKLWCYKRAGLRCVHQVVKGHRSTGTH